MSDNPIDLDDPKITAYVLGELDDAEKAEIEQQLSANGGLKSAVEEMREFTDMLGEALTSEAAPALTDAQREQIQSAAGASGVSVPASPEATPKPAAAATPAPSRGGSWPLLATTATVLTVAGVYIGTRGFDEPPVEDNQALTERSEAPEERQVVAHNQVASKTEAMRGGRDFADDDSFGVTRSDSSRFESLDKAEAEAEEASSKALFAEKQSSTRDRARAMRKGIPGQSGAASDPNSRFGIGQGFAGGGLGGNAPAPEKPQAAPVPTNAPALPRPGESLRAVAESAPSGAQPPSRRAQLARQPSAPTDRAKRGAKKDDGATSLAAVVPPRTSPKPAADNAAALAPSPARPVPLAEDKKAAAPAGKEADALESKLKKVTEERVANEDYQQIIENPFIFPTTKETVKSTFSIDVDTGSYANVRRFLSHNQLPPRNAVRIEELINYFHYDYPQPEDERPFSVNVEAAVCPWNSKHQLVRIGLKGREILKEDRPPSNLVFLVDTSGSMGHPKKLPLVKKALTMLTQQMGEGDRIAIVTYAGNAAVTLESTNGEHKDAIQVAIDQLRAGGSTNGGAGIVVAYQQAVANFYDGGTNRVIMCTDGDFNVGIPRDKMNELIEEKRKTGVYLSVCGFGTGNLKEAMMEQVANKGNGQYSYIDNETEAQKVFVEEMTGSLYTIAKDVKVQIDFNPGKVGAYRLIGYENRMLANEDFNDDTKDAGEIGAGHRVTALYEIVPPEALKGLAKRDVDEGDPSKYLKEKPVEITKSDEMLTVRLRYKRPEAEAADEDSTLIEQPLKAVAKLGMTSTEFDWAASVAMFGLILRDSQYKGQASFDLVSELAAGAKGEDKSGRRKEFIGLVNKARSLMGK